MVIVYRTLGHVGHSSLIRRLLIQFIWLLKIIENRLQLKKMLSIILMFIVTLILLPWLLLTFAVVQIGRICIRVFLRYRHPDWHFVNVSSLRCALDTHRCPGFITIFITLDGYMDLAQLQNYAKTFIQNQSEIAPILRQCITSKFNCYMWKEAKDFDITSHITVSKGFRRNKTITDSMLQNHISELCSKPLSRKSPPWEIVLIPLSKTSNATSCGILFRMHHLIAEQLPMKDVLLPTCMNLWSKDERIPLLGVNSATYKLLSNGIELLKSQCLLWKDKSNPFNKGGEKDLFIFWILIRKLVTICNIFITESHKLYSGTKFQFANKNIFIQIISLIYLFPKTFLRIGYRNILNISIGFCRLIFYCIIAPFFVLILFWQMTRLLFGQMQLLILYLHCQLCKNTTEKELIIIAGKEIMFTLIAAFIAPGVGLHEWTKTVDPVPLLQMRAWSGHRVYAWTPSVSMQLIKSISEDINATPSDVLLASCAGILRHYFRTLGSEIPDTVSATIPLCSDITSEVKEDQGFSIIALPTGEADPITRLQHVKQRMQEIRENPYKYVLSVYLLRYAFNVLPQPILTMILNYFCYKFPITITNIFIPDSAPVTLGKSNIKNMNYWRPAQGNIGLSLTLIHYSQSVSLAVASDREVLPQPSLMTSQFSKEFHDMAMMLGLRIENQNRGSPYGSPQTSPFSKTDFSFSECQS